MELSLAILSGVSVMLNAFFLYLWYLDHRPPVRQLRWSKVLGGIKKLVQKIEQSTFHPEVIVGVYSVAFGGGGMVGDILATRLRLPMHIVCVDLYANDGGIVIHGVNNDLTHGKRVLIVDDVCNTGRTLEAVRNELESTCGELKIAVIVKPTKKLPLPIQVDFWAFETPYYVLDREWAA